jgi:hypothetical protein
MIYTQTASKFFFFVVASEQSSLTNHGQWGRTTSSCCQGDCEQGKMIFTLILVLNHRIEMLQKLSYPSGPFSLKKNFQQIQYVISSLYVCMAIKHIIVLFVETPRKFITAKLIIINIVIYYCKIILLALMKIRAYGSKALQ